MKIILFGPPNAGKGTLGAMMVDRYNIPLLGTGQMFRDAIKQGTELGKVAQENINKGTLMPDELTADLVKERIKQDDCKEGYILDGFPRTLNQAELFKDEMEKIDFILEFEAPDELLIHRLTGRRLCKECGAVYNIHPDCGPHPKEEGKCDKCGGELYHRDDDTEEVMKKRLESYRNDTEPIVEQYRERVKKIDATGNPDLIMARIIKAIGK
jgi:adenylate kinase